MTMVFFMIPPSHDEGRHASCPERADPCQSSEANPVL
jgi:hypothetical protein